MFLLISWKPYSSVINQILHAGCSFLPGILSLSILYSRRVNELPAEVKSQTPYPTFVAFSVLGNNYLSVSQTARTVRVL